MTEPEPTPVNEDGEVIGPPPAPPADPEPEAPAPPPPAPIPPPPPVADDAVDPADL